MRGLRRVQQAKPPKPRAGLDDPAHKRAIRQMRCVLDGRRCTIGKWEGVYPDTEWIKREYVHQCWYDGGESDPHHTTRKSQRGHDHTTVPLCRAGHREADELTNEQFKQRWGIALPVKASQLTPKREAK